MDKLVATGKLNDPYWTILADEKTGETLDDLIGDLYLKNKDKRVRVTIEVLES